jgi:hypothetical protein
MKPTDQTWIPGTEPPPDPDVVPEIANAIRHALELREAKRETAERSKAADDAVLRLLVEHGLDWHPYVDERGQPKRWVADKTPRCKIVNAPRKENAGDRRDAADRALDALVDAIPEGATLEVRAGGRSAKVESRRVSRKDVEAEIDPFASARAAVESRDGLLADVERAQDEATP